ncbi:MAG: hypothetical protein LBF37_02675 [Rickettsiales bacterium]|nr:hypothetical protein [Rickettsiales bacterium]
MSNHASPSHTNMDCDYIYVSSITVNGRKIYASTYGKRAFRIPVKSR